MKKMAKLFVSIIAFSYISICCATPSHANVTGTITQVKQTVYATNNYGYGSTDVEITSEVTNTNANAVGANITCNVSGPNNYHVGDNHWYLCSPGYTTIDIWSALTYSYHTGDGYDVSSSLSSAPGVLDSTSATFQYP